MRVIFIAMMLGACVSNAQFIGRSVADPVLKKDVLRDIRLYERSVYGCNAIASVTTEVIAIKRTGNAAQPLIVDEVWTVDACGTKHRYPVNMRADAKGEIDYTLSFGKRTQSNDKK